MDWLSKDWSVLRPLLVVAITWVALIVALGVAWIRQLIAVRGERITTHPDADRQALDVKQIARSEFAASAQAARPTADRGARLA